MVKKNPLKVGDRVRYRDGDPHIYRVYGVYSPTVVSLSLRDYDDVEQDDTVEIDKLVKVR